MSDRPPFSDADRGLADRTGGGKSVGDSNRPAGRQAPSRSIAEHAADENEKRQLAQAKERIEEIESDNAKPGWKLASVAIDDIYHHFEGTKPESFDASDLSVSAIITFERVEKDPAGTNNYMWSRTDYVLEDLLHPDQPKERRSPVKTTKTIRSRNRQIERELKTELDGQAERQLLGIGEDEKSNERVQELTQELHENNEELIKRAKTDDDFSEALSNLETAQLLGESDNSQFENLGRRYEEERAWIEEAAEKRPDSIVNKMRHARNQATEQLLTVDEPAAVTGRWELSETDKATIREKARLQAKDRTPPGFTLSSIEVEFIDLRGDTYLTHGPTLVEVSIEASYEGGISEKGLPVRHRESWTDNPMLLLKYPEPNRRPVRKVPFAY